MFIRNFKSFNYAMNNNYHTEMEGPTEGMDYNYELVQNLQNELKRWPDMIPVKADYLAERSVEDDIILEGQ